MQKNNNLSILAVNRPGVLVKVITVISGQGINIHDMSAHITEDPGYTRILIEFAADEERLRLVTGQLRRQELIKEVIILD